MFMFSYGYRLDKDLLWLVLATDMVRVRAS